RRFGLAAMKRGAQPDETGLVTGIGRMKSMPLGERQAMTNVGLRVEIDEALASLGDGVEARQVRGAWIDHGPLQKPAPRERLDRGEALCGRSAAGGIGAAREGNRRIDDRVYACANAFDDRGIELGIVLLPPGRGVIG